MSRDLERADDRPVEGDATPPGSAIAPVDAAAGWCLGNGLAAVLVVAHPSRTPALLAVRNVLVAGLLSGVVITLLLTGYRDYRLLGRRRG